MQGQEEEPISRAGRALVLLLLRRSTAAQVQRRAWRDAGPSDVAAAISMVRRARILGVLGARADAADIRLPEAVDQEIRTLRQRSIGRHLLARRTVAAITAALPMRHAILKGPVLATVHHQDPGARAYSDIDVVVDRGSFSTAMERLRNAGYRPAMTNWEGFRAHGVAEVPLTHPDGLFNIDLHWHTVGLARDRRALRVDVGRCLDRSVDVALGEAARGQVVTQTFDPVDTLLHLCVNLGLDGSRGLRGLVDVDAVVHAAPLEASAVAERARSTRVSALVAAVLQRCASLLGTPGAAELVAGLDTPNWWLAANRAVDDARQRGTTARGLAPGWLLAAGRDRTADMVAGLRRTVGAELTRLQGNPGLTDPGGGLDWQGGEDASASIDSYLQWVGAARPMVVEPVADGAVMHALFGHDQPRTTQLLSAAAHPLSAGASISAYLVRDDDGSVLAAVVLQRVALGVTPAYVALRHDRAAAPVSRLLDRRGATTIAGFEPDIQPLRDAGRRWVQEERSTAAALSPGFGWEAPSVPTRRATAADIDELLALRRASTPGVLPPPRLLRPVQSAIIEDLTLVLDDSAGRPIGYIARQGYTAEWDLWGHMEIHPDRRGEGHAWRLLAAAAQTTRDRGAGGMTFVAATNPMPLPTDTVLPDPWIVVTPTPPRRFKGEPRLHRLLQRVRRGTQAGPDVPVVRRAGRDDQLVTDRRTQQDLGATRPEV